VRQTVGVAVLVGVGPVGDGVFVGVLVPVAVDSLGVGGTGVVGVGELVRVLVGVFDGMRVEVFVGVAEFLGVLV
jgi:hypothetical protein